MTIDDVPELACLRHRVPEGKYQPARYSKTRARAEGEQEDPNTGAALIDFPVRCSQPYQPTPPPVATPPRQPEVPWRPVKVPLVMERLPGAPHSAQRDPEWIRTKCVFVTQDITRMQDRKIFTPDSSNQMVMAPLIYIRQSPYHVRHPLDNDAIRALDSASTLNTVS